MSDPSFCIINSTMLSFFAKTLCPQGIDHVHLMPTQVFQKKKNINAYMRYDWFMLRILRFYAVSTEMFNAFSLSIFMSLSFFEWLCIQLKTLTRYTSECIQYIIIRNAQKTNVRKCSRILCSRFRSPFTFCAKQNQN